ncbi:hypothetical protein B0J12DRAFT_405503 [Macrophomina phaseolina]|uniref:Uncharacterized protein n=1 Tax=Macrophomina phaseolina TaxID=35725 RepID=A0ABQ8GIU1_9PEZI|nr:hypothetical protein B0J12DRAFT_405503 [Macrophomina phaseolina]
MGFAEYQFPPPPPPPPPPIIVDVGENTPFTNNAGSEKPMPRQIPADTAADLGEASNSTAPPAKPGRPGRVAVMDVPKSSFTSTKLQVPPRVQLEPWVGSWPEEHTKAPAPPPVACVPSPPPPPPPLPAIDTGLLAGTTSKPKREKRTCLNKADIPLPPPPGLGSIPTVGGGPGRQFLSEAQDIWGHAIEFKEGNAIEFKKPSTGISPSPPPIPPLGGPVPVMTSFYPPGMKPHKTGKKSTKPKLSAPLPPRTFSSMLPGATINPWTGGPPQDVQHSNFHLQRYSNTQNNNTDSHDSIPWFFYPPGPQITHPIPPLTPFPGLTSAAPPPPPTPPLPPSPAPTSSTLPQPLPNRDLYASHPIPTSPQIPQAPQGYHHGHETSYPQQPAAAATTAAAASAAASGNETTAANPRAHVHVSHRRRVRACTATSATPASAAFQYCGERGE